MNRHPFRLPARRIAATAAGLSAILASLIGMLSGCAVHPASSELAFLQSGQLWTILSDGAGATPIDSGPIAGYSWSPNHQQMVLRTVTTSTGAVNASDAPGNLEIISVNGGSTLQITPQEQGILRSDGWWNAQGDRLVYRESLLGAASPPMYYVSQSDQPVGIARKLVLDASGIPALSPDGKVNPKAIETVIKSLQEVNTIPADAKIDPASIYDMSFAEKALKK